MPIPAKSAAQRTFLALAIAQGAIVLSGGLVRITGSGLGCPTWPKCTKDSYTPRSGSPSGYHTIIEFSNRLVTFILIGLAVASLIFAINESRRRANRGLVLLAAIQVAGIFGQAVLGGIAVLTKLNPLPVAGHFLLSIGLIAVSVELVLRSRPDEGFKPVRSEILHLSTGLIVVAALVLTLGTLVTGSGPHAGDAAAKRFPFDPRTISFLHADVVIAFCGIALALWLALRITHADQRIINSAQVLIGLIILQGLIGYTQYFTKLPEALVAVHLLGAVCVWVATYLLVIRIRRAGTVSSMEQRIKRDR